MCLPAAGLFHSASSSQGIVSSEQCAGGAFLTRGREDSLVPSHFPPREPHRGSEMGLGKARETGAEQPGKRNA